MEAARRVDVMPTEISGWIAASKANVNGLGIHGTQLAALQDMLDALTVRQRAILAKRPAPTAASQAYAESELDLTGELVGAYELWTAFRAVFEQRRQPVLVRTSLDAADLVAADAYRSAINRAITWKVIKGNEYREPPLVCAEALGSPATAARGQQVSGLTATIERYRDKLLPIPLVLFPADRLDDIWTHATLAHEVGHDLEADLAFSSEAIAAGLGALPANTTPGEREAWRSWGAEVVADAVGVALGGAGFASALADWLLSVALAKQFKAPNGDPHPPPHVRIRVLAGLLEGTGVVAWQPIATALITDVQAVPTPAWQQSSEANARAVAMAVISTPLTALDGHAIQELSADLDADAALADTLSSYLRTGFNRVPTPNGPPVFPTRLVPSAAALAVRSASAKVKLADIALRALDYIHDIPRPAFLAPPPAGRQQFLRRLAEHLDVRS
jgi:hypothetical protein